MSRRFRLTPVSGSGAQNGLIITLPPPSPAGAPAEDGCACDDLSATWSNLDTLIVSDQFSLAVLIGHGGVCSGTEWQIAGEWVSGDPVQAEDGSWSVPDPQSEGVVPPTEEHPGVNVWVIDPEQSGIYTAAVTATCGGEEIAVATVTLVVPGF